MDSEIIRAVQEHDKQGEKEAGEPVANISDDLYKEVITPLIAEFSDPIVAPHWWKKPADNFKGFAVKTRINNTIWRQWYVHFVRGKETVVKFANPMPLADKYHARVLAVVVEGHYWCRKHGAIRAQYNTWRQTRKTLHPKIMIDNLVVNTIKQDEIISPGVDDLVLSGMLNGFSDLHALDLSVQFDLPDSFQDFDLIFPSDPQVRDPVQSSSCTNGYSDHRPASIMYPHPGTERRVAERSTVDVDTTSLNTLATAADMSEYYQSSTQSQYLPPVTYRASDETYHPSYEQPGYAQDREYNGVDTRQTVDRQFTDSMSPGAPSVVPVPEYTLTDTLANSHQNTYLTSSMPVTKGPAYYPPTRLQYCYSDKGSYNPGLEQAPLVPPPVPFPHHQPPYPDQQQTPVFKQKQSEIEVDRKRRRAMKDRLHNVEDILPPAAPGTKYTHAVILNKTAAHIRNEESILSALDADVVRLNSLIEQTKGQISVHQSQIPENGISSACFGSSIVETQYTEFLEEQVNVNPLMKLYSSMLEPLFLTFNSMVDNTSLDSFCKTAHQWFAQNCSLAKLRELATNLVTSPNLEFEGGSGG